MLAGQEKIMRLLLDCWKGSPWRILSCKGSMVREDCWG